MSRLRGWVDGVLGRVTPVVLAAIALALIAGDGLVLAALGREPFDLGEGLVSLLVALAATFFGSALAGGFAKAMPKPDSTIVTGLILFLLFTPSLDAHELTGLSIAGLAAGVSKYALVWRGRHVFNPAAVGATVAWLTTLAYPGWWAGSQALLWPVAVLALVVLYRTSTLLVGVVFVVVAAAGTWATLGDFWAIAPAGQLLAMPFAQMPFVFLAGFMLSEPLTLPPRRWQRLVVAVLVGLCVGALAQGLSLVLPFNALPPEVAVLVGNVVAWAFGARRAIGLTVAGTSVVGSGVTELRLLPAEPLRFAAGQAIELDVPHSRADLRGRLRVLSLVSAPGEAELRVAFGVPGGLDAKVSSAKRALLRLEPGHSLRATRVLGDFVLPRDPAEPVLLVAGGIGVTPFLSMIRANAGAGSAAPARDLVLAYRSSTERPAYAEELESLAASGAVRLLPFYDRRPDAAAIAAAVPDLATRTAYVSGPPRMVGALAAMLRRAGVRRVRKDVFSGA